MSTFRIRFAWFLRGTLIVGAAPLIAKASAEDLSSCSTRPVVFDGIAPLHYATVLGAKGARVYLHAQISSPGSAPEGDSSHGAAYLIPGDAVAIGKVCGESAFIQYIGAKRISVGWLPLGELQIANGTPVTPPEAPLTEDKGRYHFRLARGSGVPVCEAYLQRLNSFLYRRPPYCDRPEDDSIPGFARLNRVPLAPEEISELSSRAHEFEGGLPQGALIADNARRLALGLVPVSPWMTLEEVKSHLGDDLNVWRYAPPVSIENDGKPTNLVMWQGYGPRDGAGLCGSYIHDMAAVGEGLHKLQHAYVLTMDNRQIDSVATARIFSGNNYVWKPHIAEFVEISIGNEISIFNFRGAYYFDTFFSALNGDAPGDRRNVHSLDDVLGVFKRQRGVTSQICEYRMIREQAQSTP